MMKLKGIIEIEGGGRYHLRGAEGSCVTICLFQLSMQ